MQRGPADGEDDATKGCFQEMRCEAITPLATTSMRDMPNMGKVRKLMSISLGLPYVLPSLALMFVQEVDRCHVVNFGNRLHLWIAPVMVYRGVKF